MSVISVISDYHTTLIVSASMSVGLLIAAGRERAKMRRWRRRAFIARREASRLANLANYAETYKAQRDELASGRSTLRAIEASDIERWNRQVSRWS